LHASGAEFVGGTDARPLSDGLGSFPAEIADRRRGERDAFEHEDGMIGVVDALEFAGTDGDFVGGASDGDGKSGEHNE